MATRQAAKFFSEGLQSTRRNLGTAIGTIVTIFLSLFLVGGFYIGTQAVNSMLASIEAEVGITAYISDDATPEAIEATRVELEKIDGVSSVTLVTKEEALENFKNTISSGSTIASQLGGTNPLPASFNIELSDGRDVTAIAMAVLDNASFQAICDSPDAPNNSIKYGQQTVDRLLDMTGMIRWLGGIIVVLLIVVAFAFMNNTIRLSVGNRRKEIAIQKLVGASDFYIKGPFLAEGMLHALIGALLAILGLIIAQAIIMPSVTNTLEWLPMNLPPQTYLITYVIVIIGGLAIGYLSSQLALTRHLRKL